MPAGNARSSTKSRKKEEVLQRIQEMKQRQQNWLKQRQTSKELVNLDEKTKISVVTQNKQAAGSSAPKKHEVQNSDIVTKKVLITSEKNNVSEKFKHWINARNQSLRHEDDIPDFNDCNSYKSGAESELERLVSPDIYSVTQPVAEEEFGNLAEKIAHRVKEDLGFSQPDSSLFSTTSAVSSQEQTGIPAWNSYRSRTFTQDVPTFNHQGTPTLSSHKCAVCKQLMLSSTRIPTMVIPCGHTFCKFCLEGKQACPSCDCPVLSLTVNIMLQQVIHEYHTNHAPSSLRSESLGNNESSKSNKSFQARYTKDNDRNHRTSYNSQLENLETRHNILFVEQKTLLKKQKQLEQHLQQDQLQIQNIKRQEEEAEKAISDLQERLRVLKEHRNHYECQVKEQHNEKTQLDGKITLLSTTMTTLAQDIEKVRLLSESELRADTG